MTDETQGSSPAQESEQSWQQREIARALHRLATARAQLAALEEQGEPVAPTADHEAIESALLDGLQDEITKLRRKAAGRFGGAAARARIKECMRQQRLVLDRTGFASYDAYRAARGRAGDADRDGFLIEFAQREFDEARAAFLSIATLDRDTLEVPPSDEVGPTPEADADASDDADDADDGDATFNDDHHDGDHDAGDHDGDNGAGDDGYVIEMWMRPPTAS